MSRRADCFGTSPKTGRDMMFHRWSSSGVCRNIGCGLTRKEKRKADRQRQREKAARGNIPRNR